MGMVVQHNMNALNAYNRLNANVAGLKKSSEKLSSGYRINRAGDDAAGLAISEKMRSQIKGLNQATRNAQDGINMIQTFEGAAQETHSILQRMKELASESANGTYDNPTDRAAVQLEFDQLNDELNQIADTDFNGTIVLNGGETSDGLKVHNGEFNWATKKDDIMASAKEMYNNEIKSANQAIKDARDAMSKQNFDLSDNGDAPEWNTVDNNLYTKKSADALWQALKITDNSQNTGNAKTDVVTELNVTFEYDKDANTWNAVAATDNTGKDYAKADVTAAFAGKVTTATTANATGKGGFDVELATGETVKAIFDATNAKKGDTVTLKFTNGENSQLSPNHVGFKIDSLKTTNTSATTTAANKLNDGDFTVKLGKDGTVSIKDADMNDTYKEAFEKLNGGVIKIEYTNADTVDKASEGTKIYVGDTEITAAQLDTDLTDSANYVDVTINGHAYKVGFKEDTSAGAAKNMYIFDATDTTNALITVGLKEAKANGAAGDGTGTAGNVEFKLAIDTPKYVDSSANIRVDPGESNKYGNSKDFQDAITAGEKKLAELADVDVSDFESAKAYLTKRGVSVSDAYDNSTARMTYTDNITLQTGARTKDGVNFSFKYNIDDTADMGNLKANLNLSSRADGLNTANLSLANQKDANYAIDQIDKAINKTSMVRATFGSIQNRLEHKITNLTTTSENLTEAESSIRDTDMASEMMNYTKFNILQQAAQSMLAQANQQPQSVLQLLG